VAGSLHRHPWRSGNNPETVRGFKEILEGKHDDVAEADFYMKGGIETVKAS
jgi:F-type H+-transporting ATPase subunit beta